MNIGMISLKALLFGVFTLNLIGELKEGLVLHGNT